MSSLSLNRLCNGGGRSKNKSFNFKFGSSSTLPLSKNVTKIPTKITDLNNNANAPIPATRRKLLNPRGSLFHNQFKGVKKDLIEKHANLIVHTMTVSHIYFSSSDDLFFPLTKCKTDIHTFSHFLFPTLTDRGAL